MALAVHDAMITNGGRCKLVEREIIEGCAYARKRKGEVLNLQLVIYALIEQTTSLYKIT